MYDEGHLKDLMRTTRDRNDYGHAQGPRIKGFTKSVRVSTNEYTRAVKGKRGASGTYAAVHNDPNQLRPGTPQRQFIGHSRSLDDKIAAIIPEIFKNIPNQI